MKNNKSIDGLTIRDASKSPAKTTAKSPKINRPTTINRRKISVAKTSTAKSPAKTKVKQTKTNTNSIKQETVNNTINISTNPIPTETTAKSAQSVEDFLKPVHAFDFDGETGELKASSKKLKKSDKKSKKELKKLSKKEKKEKKKPGKIRRTITIIALIIILVISGLITWAVFWGNDIIAKITGGQGNVGDLIKFIEPTYEPLKTDTNGRTNILAFGTSGYDMSGDEGGGVHDGAQLTDSIMLISLNQDTGDVAMLSLPRDLKASPTCTATGKINEVYWCNNMYGEDENAGATALMEEVGSILGVDFQYYVHINWGSLISIVDILEGIDVTLDEGVYDYVYFEPGVTYHLNGEDALALARTRHGTSGGDFSRGANQQKILIGIKDRVLEKDLSIIDLVNIASTLGDNLRTNFSIDELKTLAHLTFDFDFNNMRQLPLYNPSEGVYYVTTGILNNGISYVFPSAGVGNYYAIQNYVSSQLSNDPRDREDPSIIILNATDTVGLASEERNSLTEAGYYINDIDNAPEDINYTEQYTIYTNNTKPGTKEMLEDYYNITIKSIDEAPESITRSYDFVIILGSQTQEETE